MTNESLERRVARIERALFGGMAEDGVTWNDGLVQSLRALADSVETMRGDRKWVFALLGVIAVGQTAATAHAYGLWEFLGHLFGVK